MMRFKSFGLSLALTMIAFSLSAAEVPSSQTQSPAAAKSYQIRNKKFGDLLRPQDANSADGTSIVLYPAQPWKCMTWRLDSAGTSAFTLRNHFTSKTFSAKSGAAVVQVPLGKNADERQTWQLTKLKDGSYRIADPKSGQALSAQKNGSDVKIVLEPSNDSDNQKWDLEEIDPAKLTM